DGADGIFIIGIARAFIVIGHGAEFVTSHQFVERYRCTGGTLQFFFRTIGLYIKSGIKQFYAFAYGRFRYIAAKGSQLIYFYQFNMAAKKTVLLGEVAINIQHAAVIVPHTT